jgi:hypothetical protein
MSALPTLIKPSEATKNVYRGLSILKPSAAVADVLDYLPGRYAPYTSTLWANVRHHCAGGRTESERFMDRRSWGEFENRAIRRMHGAPMSEDELSSFAPSKRKIYPARVSKEDVRRRDIKEAICLCGCGRKLNAKRRKAKWFSDACRMRAKRTG